MNEVPVGFNGACDVCAEQKQNLFCLLQSESVVTNQHHFRYLSIWKHLSEIRGCFHSK